MFKFPEKINSLEAIGWLGGVCLAFCGAPEAYRALREEYYSISIVFLFLWLFGEVCILIPVILQVKKAYLIFNYALNIFFILIILGRVLNIYGRIL